jgi:hypothetical protein
VVVYTGRCLCARISVSKANGGLLLFVVYHHAHGGITNNFPLKYHKEKLHIYFLSFDFGTECHLHMHFLGTN